MTRVERTGRVKRITAVKTAIVVSAAFISVAWLARGPEIEVEPDAPKEAQSCVVYEAPVPPVILMDQEPSADEIAIAKAIWGEARGCSKTEQAAVAWCVLNRVDDKRWPDSAVEVLSQPKQFTGYTENNPVEAEQLEIAQDVMNRYEAEKSGVKSVGRVLPEEYVFFWGDNVENHFTAEWLSGPEWTWELPSPYGEEA